MKLELSALETEVQPSLRGFVAHGEVVEEGDAVLGEREEVFCQGVVQHGAGVEDTERDDDGRMHTSVGGRRADTTRRRGAEFLGFGRRCG